MLTVQNIFKRYGPVRVLSGVSFAVDRGWKIALVGPNGVGKSTLLRILAGFETEDKGRIIRNRRMLAGYLPQEVESVAPQETVFDHFRRVAGIDVIESEMRELEGKLSDDRLLVRYGELQEDYERLGGYVFEKKVRRALDGLGLSSITLDRTIASLSGGERRRVALAAVLLRGADLLLLDEPTNDLDLEALFFLEDYLKKTEAAVLVASHDRTFLDAVVDRVIEIDWYFRTTRMFPGNWSAYRSEKAEALRRAQELYERGETERYRLRGTAEEKKVWARIGGKMVMPDRDKMSQGFHRNRSEQKFYAAAKSLMTRARKVRKIKVPPTREELAVLFAPQSGENRGITLTRVVAGYGAGGFRIGPFDLDLPYGARVGLFGRNGSGKSTVLKTVSGMLDPMEGKIERGAETNIGIIDQQCGIVPREKTALEWFARETPIREEEVLADYLGRFLLNPEAITFRLGELSPGERMRMALAFLMATEVNILLLDEPTNHLDMEAIESLETALGLYQGTLLLVSHDRSFLEHVPLTRLYSIGGGKLIPYPDYASYLSAAESSAREGMKTLGVAV